jgi:hypothetical protein
MERGAAEGCNLTILSNDVYNTDEVVLFYKLMLNKTLAFKGKWCTGGKNSKERITVVL